VSTTLTATDAATALSERLFSDLVTMTEILALHLGGELDLFDALADESLTPGELADRAGIHPRYAREWLEQLAVAGFVTCDNPDDPADARRFGLAPAVAEVFLDTTSPAYARPLIQMAGGFAAVIRDVVHAYRTGGGVPYHAYGHEVRHGLGEMNGAYYDEALPGWIASQGDVDHLLRTHEQPRILDLGSGVGRSSMALARAYPKALVRGVDLDGASVTEAREAAAGAGLAHRVTFVEGDAATVDDSERYHLVTILEALHDMGDPIGALRQARQVLEPGGAVIVMDERCEDHFRPDGDLVERFLYGASALHCLPATMAEEPVLANGTLLRAPVVEAWAGAAGFGGATVLPIETEFWRLYRLDI